MFDLLLLLVVGASQLVMAYLGVRMTTRPIKDAWLAEIRFLAIGAIGFLTLIWSGIRSSDVQEGIRAGIQQTLVLLQGREQPTAVLVGMPVAMSCVPNNLEQEPIYADTDAALKAAPDAAARYQLLAVGRVQREAWLSQVRPVLDSCRGSGEAK